MERPYTVALQDTEDLPGPERIAAECRFISALERILGNPAAVAATYRAWVAANESAADRLDRTTAAMAVRWPQAYLLAMRAALGEVYGPEQLAFKLRLARTH